MWTWSAGSPYSQRFHFILLGDAAEIRPEPFAQLMI
jgi:hypothetical protein